jgi:hypothetical protein
MDAVDQAQKQTDLDISVALSNRKPSLPAKGSCYWCDEPIKSGIYCDAYCGECHEKSSMINGG